MIPDKFQTNRKARLLHTVLATGLLAAVLVTALGAFALALSGGAAPVAARPLKPVRHSALGSTHPYTSPTGTATTSVTATATITEPTATLTATPTDPPTATASPTPTPSATPRPTTPPQPVHLPVLLRDPACVPQVSYSDIVFVVDVSNYMRNTVDGLIASEWARYWMRTAVDKLDLTRTRLAVVQFNRDVVVRQPLTNDRQAVLDAIAAKPERENSPTRMDVALRAARDLLLGDGATPGNAKVIFFISHMQARDIPWRGIPGCVEERGDECAALFVANEVKNGPGAITIYALATSWYGGGEDLKGIASDPSKAILMPSQDDLARICDATKQLKPCDNNQFWPRARP